MGPGPHRPLPPLAGRPHPRRNPRLPGPRQLRRPQPHPHAGTRRIPRWHDRLGGLLRHGDAVHTPSHYLEQLTAPGRTADVWETTYLHLLQGEDPVLDWVKGTGLRPVLDALADDPEARDAFLTEYRDLLRTAYPAGPHGTVFPFRRIFAVTRTAG